MSTLHPVLAAIKLATAMALTIVSSPTHPADSTRTFELKGAALGQSFKDFSLSPRCDGYPIRCREVLPSFTIAGRRARILSAEFDYDEKLVDLSIVFDSTDYPTVKRDLTKKYGRPKGCASRTMQNVYGARYDAERCYWKRPTSQLYLDSLVDKPGDALVSISTDAYLDKHSDRKGDGSGDI